MPPRRSTPQPRSRKPTRPRRTTVEPDPDYLTDLEQSDGQKWKRRTAADRGKPVKPPEPRNG